MRSVTEMTHYEILEVGWNADAEELERAYRMARSTFADDSMALYSVFDPREAAAVRSQIELAYRVLSDDASRREYDAQLATREHESEPEAVEIALAFDSFDGDPRSEAGGGGEVPSEFAELDDFESEEEDEFDGARLRRSRLQRGVDLEQLASVTKINPTYLRFIEEERFRDLPAAVYVRGFVTAYARCLGLDVEQVVPDYMERYQAGVQPPARSRRA